MRKLHPIWLLAAVAACGEDGPAADAGPNLPPWNPGLPEASVMHPGAVRGLVAARGIVHLHSPYSHDACDGDPKHADGTIKEDCAQSLRRGLCTTAMDFAALTDHDDSMADEPWGPSLFLVREGDELITNPDGSPYASRMTCPDGRRILLFVGGENDLMPIMLDAHPEGTPSQRHAIYNGNDLATVATFRSLGGLAWIAHSESKDLQLLRDLKLDGMEVYNLHAAIDPDIRRDHLGLSASEAINKATQFADEDPNGPEPDLAILSFLQENVPSVTKWETLLAEGYRMAVTAGTDAHENALPIMMRDGERADSYRRMMRWFSNVVLVANPDDPRQIELAVAQGRMFVVFEVLGTPEGFDVRAEKSDGSVAELGAELRLVDGAKLVVTRPRVAGLDPSLPTPEVRTRVIRVDGTGTHEVRVSNEREISVRIDEPGAYRVEVRMRPLHLGPYLRKLQSTGYAERDHVWIYTSPIYVRP